jgi:thymidylate synthase (FAD)
MKLLDHGYLDYVEHWGSDESIVRAARMSTGFLGWGPNKTGKRIPCPNHDTEAWCSRCGGPEGDRMIDEEKAGDEGLLRYMWKHEHGTPFEMAGLTIEVQAPIFVFREWHRHRVPFGYNELSARYTPMPYLNYMPTVERIVEGSKQTKNRQASSVAGECNEHDSAMWLKELRSLYMHAEAVYQMGLKYGIPKELARLPVPVGRYSRMRATGNLRGWLAFCKLRCAPQTQWEIRQYANAVGELLSKHFPRTWEIFNGPR